MRDAVSCISHVCSRRARCLVDLHMSVTHLLSFLLLSLLPTIHPPTPPAPQLPCPSTTPPAAMHDGQARYCAWHLQQVLVGATFPYWIRSACCGQLSAFSVIGTFWKKNGFALIITLSVLFTLKLLGLWRLKRKWNVSRVGVRVAQSPNACCSSAPPNPCLSDLYCNSLYVYFHWPF